MVGEQGRKRYDLEDRTFAFAQNVRAFAKRLPKTLSNAVDVRQLIRSSGSVGANYIEANESLSRKDFRMRIKICRKEAKETQYWLRLIETGNDPEMEAGRKSLLQEATELTNIFGAILRKTE
jgi:four helix bundle protein